MKKLILSLMIALLLVGSVSASILTTHSYSEEDLKVKFKTLGLIDIGEATLSSHNPVNEIKGFGYGKEEVVMWYDFSFNEVQQNGLGNVEIVNMKTGEEELINYQFVIWDDVEVPVYGKKCTSYTNTNGSYVEDCVREQIGTEEEKQWIDYNSLNIPKDARIGIKVMVEKGDHYDAVWNIIDEKINKHAEWSAGLNVDLWNYYKLNETSGTLGLDSVLNKSRNMTHSGPDVNANGKIGRGVYYNGGVDFSYQISDSEIMAGGNYWTLAFWTNRTSTSACFMGAGTTSANVIWALCETDADTLNVNKWGGNPTIEVTDNVGEWEHFVAIYNASGTVLYQNGVNKGAYAMTLNLGASYLALGRPGKYAGSEYVGWLDEVGLWNRTLSPTEITDLYNGGAGMTYTTYFNDAPVPVQSYPATDFNTSSNSIEFNYSCTDDSQVNNVTLYIDNIVNLTTNWGISADTGIISTTKTFADGSHNWTVVCEDDGTPPRTGTTEDRNFTIDLTDPILNIIYPTGDTGDNYVTSTTVALPLNWSSTDANLETCSFYNVTSNLNETITCGTNTTMYSSYGTYTFFVYANDTFGNIGTDSQTSIYTYKVLENSLSHNVTSYETSKENFNINVTKGSGITDLTANFWYNGTKYTPTEVDSTGSSIFSYSLSNVPLLGTAGTKENRTIVWEIYADTTSLNKTTSQNVLPINLTSCTTGTKFLNITFKDEATLTYINASIPTSTFVYGLGDLSLNRTLSFINNTANLNYSFCFEPKDKTVTSNTYVQYKQGTAYPQRIYDLERLTYVNTTTELTLYLLSASDGIYVTFQVINPAEQPISGVEINGTRVIDGSPQIVAQGTTDAAGLVTFWLNPDFSHTFVFDKTGYDLYTYNVIPTQSSYTITLGGSTTTGPDYTQGISYFLTPTGDYISNGTTYDFNFSITSSFWDLDSFGITLYNNTGDSLGTDSSVVTTGGIVTVTESSSTYTSMYTDYTYTINGTQINGSRTWIVVDTTGTSFSINHFFQDLVLYIDAGFFGFDDFGKAILSFLILVVVAGSLSSKYGLNSEAAIMGIIFGTVLFLDVGIGLIPNPTFGGLNPVDNLITTIMGILLVGTIMREEMK